MLALIMSHAEVTVLLLQWWAANVSFPALYGRTGCTCGQVSMVVTMVFIITAPGWCNDKGGDWLSLISSSISIYYRHRHEHHHTVTGSAGCNLAVRRAFPAAALPHVRRSSTYTAVFVFLSCLSLHCNLRAPTCVFQVTRNILCLSKFVSAGGSSLSIWTYTTVVRWVA